MALVETAMTAAELESLLDESYDWVESYIDYGQQKMTKRVKKLADVLVSQLGANASDEQVMITLGAIKSYHDSHTFSKMYRMLGAVEKNAAAPGLLIPLMERDSPELRLAASQAVVSIFFTQISEKASPDLGSKAVDVLTEFLPTTNAADKEQIRQGLTNLVGRVESQAAANKLTIAFVSDTVGTLMDATATAKSVEEAASALNFFLFYVLFLPSEEQTDAAQEVFEKCVPGFYPARISALLQQATTNLLAGEEDGQLSVAVVIQLLQVIDKTINSGLNYAVLPGKPDYASEGIKRRRMLILSDAGLVKALKQLLTKPDNFYDFAVDSATILTVLMQTDRSQVITDRAAGVQDAVKLLRYKPDNNLGFVRYVCEYLQDPECLTAAVADDSFRESLSRYLHSSLEKGTALSDQILGLTLRLAESKEHNHVLKDQEASLDRALLIWMTEPNHESTASLAAQALAKTLENDDDSSERIQTLANSDVVPRLRHLLVADNLDYEGRKSLATIIAFLQGWPTDELQGSTLSEACDNLLSNPDERAQASVVPILAWARAALADPNWEQGVFGQTDPLKLVPVIDRLLADKTPPDQVDDRGVIEHFMRLDDAYLTGSSRLARLALFELACHISDNLAEALGTFCSSPLALGEEAIDFYEEPELPPALHNYRLEFSDSPYFGDEDDTDEEGEGVEAIEEDAQEETAVDEKETEEGQAEDEVREFDDSKEPTGEGGTDADDDDQPGWELGVVIVENKPLRDSDDEEEEEEEPAEEEDEDNGGEEDDHGSAGPSEDGVVEEEEEKLSPEEVARVFAVACVTRMSDRPIVVQDVFRFLESPDEAIRTRAVALLDDVYILSTGSSGNFRVHLAFVSMHDNQLLPRLLKHMQGKGDVNTIFSALASFFHGHVRGFQTAAGASAVDVCDFALSILEGSLDGVGEGLATKEEVLSFFARMGREADCTVFREEHVAPAQKRWEDALRSLLQTVESDKEKYQECGQEFTISALIRELGEAWAISLPPAPVVEQTDEVEVDGDGEEGADKEEEEEDKEEED